MISKNYIYSLFVVAATSCLCMAQNNRPNLSDPTTAYNTAASAIESQNWDKGLQAINAVMAAHGSRGKERFGPVFGHFFYLQGLLHLGKKEYGPARTAFKTCAEKYTNEKDAATVGEKALLPNQFVYSAMVQWGNVEMIEKNWGQAAELFDKVLKEKPQDDSRVDSLVVTVNLGKSLIKAGKLDEGYKRIIPALERERSVGKATQQIVFMILADDWTPKKKLSEVRDFINKYRHVVDHDSEENRFKRNPNFQVLAQKALENSDPIRSLLWYSLMVDPEVRISTIDREVSRLERINIAERFASSDAKQKAKLESDKAKRISNFRKEKNQIIENNRQLMNGTGVSYLQMMNFSASFAIFDRLSSEVSKNYKDRPLYLHNAVVSATQIGKWKEAYKHGKTFIDAYPDHELFPSVARVLVEVIFVRAEYQRAYEISNEVRRDMAIGAEMRDIPDFINGASAFQIGEVEIAERELEAYHKNYPNAKRAEPASFFLGLAKVRLLKWEEAAEILNKFITDYPTSTLVPDALYQCGLSEFQIDRVDEALAKVERYRKEFAGHQLNAQVSNLRGDIFASQQRGFAEIEANYLEGKQSAYKLSEEETAAYALWQLVIHTADANEIEKVADLITQFEARHGSSLYRLDFLAASLESYPKLDRKDEGLAKIKKAAYEFSDRPASNELAELFGSYFDYLKSHYRPEEVLKELQSSSDNALDAPTIKGWLLVALIDFLEGEKVEEGEQPPADKYYYRLDSGFEPEKNSNFVIVKLARWHAEVRNNSAKARLMYDYIIDKRPDSADSNFAVLDTARLLAKSSNPADHREAMTRFNRVLAEQTDSESIGYAKLGIARLHTKKNDFAKAQKFWDEYRENKEWRKAKAEASYEAARCADELGEKQKALVLYINTYTNYEGTLDWSTKGYMNAARLTYEKGEVGNAYKIMNDMVSRIGHHDHPGIREGRKLFDRYKSEYTPSESEIENQ